MYHSISHLDHFLEHLVYHHNRANFCLIFYGSEGNLLLSNRSILKRIHTRKRQARKNGALVGLNVYKELEFIVFTRQFYIYLHLLIIPMDIRELKLSSKISNSWICKSVILIFQCSPLRSPQSEIPCKNGSRTLSHQNIPIFAYFS